MMRVSTFLMVLFALVCVSQAVSLSRGSKGADVYGLQYLLRSHGISVGIDGDYGPGTEGAVRDFQSSFGLSPTGSLNIQTFNFLQVLVRRGSSNRDAVRALQYMLVNKWYMLSGSIDGIFGSGTETAVKNFQFSKSLATDGIVGKGTWTDIFDSTSSSGGSVSSSDRATLATKIFNAPGVTLATVHVDQSSVARNSARYVDSTAFNNIKDIAEGGRAWTSCYKNAAPFCRQVDVSISLLRCLADAADRISYSVSEVAGANHSVNSKHYNGWAVDINFVGGVHVAASGSGFSNALIFSDICRQHGATLVLDPSNEPQYHHNHIHCQWPSSN